MLEVLREIKVKKYGMGAANAAFLRQYTYSPKVELVMTVSI